MIRREPGVGRLARGVLSWPRLVRILMTAVFALSVTILLSPLVDSIYIRYFFSDATRMLPSLVSAAAGLGMYALGWLLLVGTVAENLPARPAVVWYCGAGLLAVVLVAVLLVIGWVSGSAPIG